MPRAEPATCWKLVRTFDDPATWTEPGVRQLASTAPGGPTYRTEPLPDQWELYDLDADPIEVDNRWTDDPASARSASTSSRRSRPSAHAAVPERNEPWPYAERHGTERAADRVAATAGPAAAPPGPAPRHAPR